MSAAAGEKKGLKMQETQTHKRNAYPNLLLVCLYIYKSKSVRLNTGPALGLGQLGHYLGPPY